VRLAPLIDLQGVGADAVPDAGIGLSLPRHPVPGVPTVAWLTCDGAGAAIADHLLARRAGALVLSDGDGALLDDDVLLGALRWAATVGLPVLGRPTLGALERGVWAEGPHATRRGLAPVHRAAESGGVHRWAALAEVAGARVHLTPLWSADGVEALRHHRRRGSTLSGGTSCLHAFVAPVADWRAWPVLGDDGDRAALCEGLRDGTLTTLSTGARAADGELAPLPESAPRGLDPVVAVGLALDALGAQGLAEVMGEGPRGLLGLEAPDLEQAGIELHPGELRHCAATGASAPTPVGSHWGLVSPPLRR
jgi:dihydroorotase